MNDTANHEYRIGRIFQFASSADLSYLLALLELPDGRERLIADVHAFIARHDHFTFGPAAVDGDTRTLRERLYLALHNERLFPNVQSLLDGTRNLVAIDWPPLKAVQRHGRMSVCSRVWAKLMVLPREELIRRLRDFLRGLGGSHQQVADHGVWR